MKLQNMIIGSSFDTHQIVARVKPLNIKKIILTKLEVKRLNSWNWFIDYKNNWIAGFNDYYKPSE